MRAKHFVAGMVLLMAAPVFAHHSFKAEYDETRQVTITGTVTKVLWKNPHVMLDVDVKEDSKQSSWELELASPNGLMSQGWKVDSIKPGDQVTAVGFPAKDGANLLSAKKITIDAH
ncbi:MAG TPA: DUF6152 family protein [Bryobacteraceae bacterium]|nr:DUF6152 family protein [Bryobacteraceae bacterium]